VGRPARRGFGSTVVDSTTKLSIWVRSGLNMLPRVCSGAWPPRGGNRWSLRLRIAGYFFAFGAGAIEALMILLQAGLRSFTFLTRHA
jgi:hypothetical protein